MAVTAWQNGFNRLVIDGNQPIGMNGPGFFPGGGVFACSLIYLFTEEKFLFF
jgi:hypothetical protein